MLQDLGIGYVVARSPQSKGRIERLWATLQDRLAASCVFGIRVVASAA